MVSGGGPAGFRSRDEGGASGPDAGTRNEVSGFALGAMDLRMLGDARAARDLDHDTLDRYRRSQGQDHLSTLHSASNLADLRTLGEAREAKIRAPQFPKGSESSRGSLASMIERLNALSSVPPT